MSQRMRPELVVEEYVMKKKKGPFINRWLGGRVVSWKCTDTGCPYHCRTLEGHITSEVAGHNHPPNPDALVKKEARALMKLKLTSSTDHEQLIKDLLGSVMPEYRDSLGSEDSFRQVARRVKRKRQREGEMGLQEDVTFDVTADGTVTYDGVLAMRSHDNGLMEEEEYVVNVRDDIMVEEDLESLMESNIEVVSLEELPATESSISNNPKTLPKQQDDNTFKIIEVDSLLNPEIVSHQNKPTIEVKVDQKKFDCNKCPASFKFLEKLSNHKQYFHTDEESFYCKECGINFYTKALLQSHQTMHIEEQASQQSCKECNLTFPSPEDTRLHLAIHNEKTIFPCTECIYVSSEESNLKSHTETHKIKRKTKSQVTEHALEKISTKQLYKNTKILDTNVDKPPNAFILFCRKERSKLLISGLEPSEISQELARRWTELQQEEKLPFFHETERLKNAHISGNS